MDKNGYIIFNGDGTKPKATIAVLIDEIGVKVIIDGYKKDVIMALGTLANDIVNTEKLLPLDMVHGAIDAGCDAGKAFPSILKFAESATDEEFDKLIDALSGEADEE